MSRPSNNRLAVLDLASEGFSSGEARTLTDRLRAEIVRTGKFDVMNREQMEAIFQEHHFVASGMCDQASCVLKAGRMLEVQKIVSGRISRFGDLYTLTISLTDVQTTRIEKTATRDHRRKIEDLLMVIIPEVAQELAEIEIQHPSSVFGKWWFWTILVGLVVGGVLFALSSGEEDEPSTGTVIFEW